MRLQDAGEHDRDAVQDDLREEDPQHRRPDLLRPRAAVELAEQQPYQHRGEQHAEQR